MDQELHQLIQDNDCHWYVVPVVYLDTFNEMMKCEWDEITDIGYKMLDEWRVDGPHQVNFMWPTSHITSKESDEG